LPEGVRPRRLAIAADNTVYFTDFKSGHFGILNTTTRAVKLFPSPGGAQSNAYGIAITPDGNVWYSKSGVNIRDCDSQAALFHKLTGPRNFVLN
jgi:streptogramin lyase